MTGPQIIIFAILGAILVLFLWGRFRYDVVAFVALLAAVLAGVVPAEEAFAGFGHPATVTVAVVLILSRALSNAGATDILARILNRFSDRPTAHVATLAGMGAVLSSFMNNVGALALLMPVAIQSAVKAKRSPALLLMPLSFGCILGGLVTLIGTPPNIIIAAYRQKTTGEPFLMFDFSPVGGIVALAGVAFVALLGWRIIAGRSKGAARPEDVFSIDGYVAEVRVPKDCKSIGDSLKDVKKAMHEHDVEIVGMIRGKRGYAKIPLKEELKAGDILIIEAAPEDIEKVTTDLGLEIVGGKDAQASLLQQEDTSLMEAVVSPGSRIEGRTVAALRLSSRYGVSLIAVSRQGKPHRGRLRDFKFRVGDALLLYGDMERLPVVISSLGCLPLAERDLQFGRRHMALVAVAMFAAAIAAGTLGILPLQIALSLAAAGMVVSNIVPLREVYEAIDWPVIVLLGAMIPIGNALEATGATGLMVSAFLGLADGVSPVVVLFGLLIVTMTLSDILNNAATAVVMAPIAATLAAGLGVSPDPFLMAVAIGASCAFLTPIGHQNNALVMGPGGYKFGDYWRMGLPLEVLIVAVAVPMILVVWPL